MNKRRQATQRRQISLPLCSWAHLPLIPPYLSDLFPPFCLCSIHPGEAVRCSQWDRGSGNVFGGGLGGEGGVISIWHQTQTIERTNRKTRAFLSYRRESREKRREMRLPFTYSLQLVPPFQMDSRPCCSVGGTWRLQADPMPRDQARRLGREVL